MTIRSQLAIAAGRATQHLTRSLRLGGGTNLPGRIARRIDPQLLSRLTANLPGGVVLVTGTNGKTTTTRMLSTILTSAGQQVLHNRAGANLITGLTAAALSQGRGGRSWADVALFEVDEAHLPAAIVETQPRLVLLHNLFRDQLDRYGEVDTIAGRWREALATLSPEAIVLLNADDPAVADLGINMRAHVCYYGLEDTSHGAEAARHTGDSIFCRRCGTSYNYEPLFYGHIGHYRCGSCGHARPAPHFAIQRLLLNGAMGSRIVMRYPDSALEIELPLPGLYNSINALAAASAALLLKIRPAIIRDTLERFSAAFGRIERIKAGQHQLLMALIKNPVGASETVRMLVDGATGPLYLLIAINDKTADGTDVSWLWDADFERLHGSIAHAVVTGTRARDMAVRLKYAGIDEKMIEIHDDLGGAFDVALKTTPDGETMYLLPTYTAMLELREELRRRGFVGAFWED